MFTRTVFILIGLLLAFTASAKLWMLMTDPFADLVSGFPTWVMWAGVYVEFSAAWIVLDPKFSLHAKSYAVLCLFIVFATISSLKLKSGAENCGCLGEVPIHPAWSLVVGLTIILFAAFQLVSASGEGSFCKPRAFGIGRTCRMKLLAWIAAASFATLATAAMLEINDKLSTPYVMASPVILEASEKSDSVSALLELQNLAHEELTVVGSQRSCNCLVPTLPVRLQKQSKTQIPVQIRAKSGRFRLILFLNSKLQQQVPVDIVLVPPRSN